MDSQIASNETSAVQENEGKGRGRSSLKNWVLLVLIRPVNLKVRNVITLQRFTILYIYSRVQNRMGKLNGYIDPYLCLLYHDTHSFQCTLVNTLASLLTSTNVDARSNSLCLQLDFRSEHGTTKDIHKDSRGCLYRLAGHIKLTLTQPVEFQTAL